MRKLDWNRDRAPDGRMLIDVAAELWQLHGTSGGARALAQIIGRPVSRGAFDQALSNHNRRVYQYAPGSMPVAAPPATRPESLPRAPEGQADRGRGTSSQTEVRQVAAPAFTPYPTPPEPVDFVMPPEWQAPGAHPSAAAPQQLTDEALLRAENRELLAEVTRLRKGALTEERVRRELLKMAEAPRHIPAWLVDASLSPAGSYGVPTLFSSDQHLGEVVDPAQIGGVNRYDLDIARRRWRQCTEKTVSLCFNFLARPQFDGVVAAFGGDGLSGNIHAELVATNERPVLPLVMEYADLIAWSVRELRRAFGRVFVPCVIGNHTRQTEKPVAKDAAFTSFDWLAYQMAARTFEGDDAVQFLIPSGPDARFQIYQHRYLLTHGAQFRGGDGIIGPLGPVFRGDAKKRARNAQIDQSYDTLLVGHFHQLRMDARVIMNGSLKGYDEYAFGGNFPWEPPRQALWLTHPQMGITFSMPVLAEDPPAREAGAWATAA